MINVHQQQALAFNHPSFQIPRNPSDFDEWFMSYVNEKFLYQQTTPQIIVQIETECHRILTFAKEIYENENVDICDGVKAEFSKELIKSPGQVLWESELQRIPWTRISAVAQDDYESWAHSRGIRPLYLKTGLLILHPIKDGKRIESLVINKGEKK
jgi:hypothetical protein